MPESGEIGCRGTFEAMFAVDGGPDLVIHKSKPILSGKRRPDCWINRDRMPTVGGDALGLHGTFGREALRRFAAICCSVAMCHAPSRLKI
jgi:hypothetical protein